MAHDPGPAVGNHVSEVVPSFKKHYYKFPTVTPFSKYESIVIYPIKRKFVAINISEYEN